MDWILGQAWPITAVLFFLFWIVTCGLYFGQKAKTKELKAERTIMRELLVDRAGKILKWELKASRCEAEVAGLQEEVAGLQHERLALQDSLASYDQYRDKALNTTQALEQCFVILTKASDSLKTSMARISHPIHKALLAQPVDVHEAKCGEFYACVQCSSPEDWASLGPDSSNPLPDFMKPG